MEKRWGVERKFQECPTYSGILYSAAKATSSQRPTVSYNNSSGQLGNSFYVS